MDKRYISLPEAATRTGMSPKTFYNWHSLGLIGPKQGVHQVGRKVVVDWDVFEDQVVKKDLRGAA